MRIIRDEGHAGSRILNAKYNNNNDNENLCVLTQLHADGCFLLGAGVFQLN